MTETCKNCRHYGFYQMITQGPYGYAGTIPCLHCERFSPLQDNYEPLEKESVESTGIFTYGVMED